MQHKWIPRNNAEIPHPAQNRLSRLISVSRMLLFLRWATGWHRAGSKGLQLWHWYCCKGAQHRKGAATALYYPLTVSNMGLQIHLSYYSLVIWRTDTRGSCLSQLSLMTAESSRIQTQQYWRRTEQPSRVQTSKTLGHPAPTCPFPDSPNSRRESQAAPSRQSWGALPQGRGEAGYGIPWAALFCSLVSAAPGSCWSADPPACPHSQT